MNCNVSPGRRVLCIYVQHMNSGRNNERNNKIYSYIIYKWSYMARVKCEHIKNQTRNSMVLRCGIKERKLYFIGPTKKTELNKLIYLSGAWYVPKSIFFMIFIECFYPISFHLLKSHKFYCVRQLTKTL